MAGFVTIGNNKYIGTCTLLTGAQDLQNGTFVAVDWSASTAATPVASSEIAYFAENVIDTVEEEQINDVDYVVTAGNYVRIKRMVSGEVFVTDQATTELSIGDIVDVGTTGVITATKGSPEQTFQVIDTPTLWGATAYKCLTLS